MPTRKPGKAAAVQPPAVESTSAPQEQAEPDRPVFPVVGIGASAGGLAAFEAFFSAMPAGTDPGVAFVLIQHLAPDHKSILAELIARRTRMQVFEVVDGMVVRPNCAFIIPPNRDMALVNGTLQLLEPLEPRGRRLPIDFFFRSLAADQHERAICVVLSGTGSDGTLGLRAIKAEGGMAMAQSPDSTEFDGMPSSAIATGLVDYELPPAQMPERLIAYVAHAFGHLARPADVQPPKTDNALKKIFMLLRAQVGHDFAQYKPSTIQRRIERRMAVHQIDTMDAYVKYLQQTPPELEALFGDLLIGVTHFFRDPVAFLALEQDAIPRLFKGRRSGAAVRVWSCGCSTGEEAYSIAILLQEHMEALKASYKVQVFATDIDQRAIVRARAGLFPASIAADLSPERLARYFTAEADTSTYRVNKAIRDMVVFSQQDVAKDPPFSRLDLVICRNLLIYMGGDLQKKLIPVFHYTLNPGGILFLGTSETVGDFTDLFTLLNAKAKLYLRKENAQALARVPSRGGFLPLVPRSDGAPIPSPGPGARPAKRPVRELTEQALLMQIPLAGALVNAQGDILYLHGRTGMYLEPAPGEAGISNVVQMARDGLKRKLKTSLHRAATEKVVVRAPGLRVKTNGHFSTVNLTVRPVVAGPADAPESVHYLVALEEVVEPTPSDGPVARPAGKKDGKQPGVTGFDDPTRPDQGVDDPSAEQIVSATAIAGLQEELRAHEEYRQAANEELETSNEELKSSNEEMQSVNEELQSTNEELETSKEEMQSINEELSTVNSELQTKVVELMRASNDLNNLLASTGIGTVFVDHQLRIMRFTPTATRIINLIPSDVGRPVAHTVSNLVGYASLVADAQGVLDSLVPKAVEVQTTADEWYAMRIQPYRTLENVIEGAVITFVNITDVVRSRDDLRKANELLRLAVVVRDAHDAITLQDMEGRILAWNPGAVRMYGWTEAQALAMNVRDRIPPERRDQELLKVRQLSQDEILEPYRTQRIAKGGAIVDVSLTATALLDDAGKVYAIATTERARANIAAPGADLHNDPHEPKP